MKRICLAFLIVFTATEANARVCADHAKLSAELKKDHKEIPMIAMVQSNNSVLEVFVNEDSGTWTMINVRPNGFSCIMGAGQGYVSKLKRPGERS